MKPFFYFKLFKNKLIKLFLLIAIFSTSLYAQEVGSFFIRGQVQKMDVKIKRDIPIQNATITLYQQDKIIATQKTKPKGDFEFNKLQYGAIYKVVFNYKGCIEMFVLVNANIPANKTEYDYGIESNFILYDSATKELNIQKFKYPFMKAAFNGKQLAIDEKYTKNFIDNILPEMEADEKRVTIEKQNQERALAELKKAQKKEADDTAALENQRIKIAGKLITGENPSKPLSNNVLKLVDDKGEVVQTVTTNFLGAFVFYLLPNKNYDFTGDNSKIQPNAKVVFTNKNDNEFQNTIADPKGNFKFKLLANDNKLLASIIVNDTDLKMDLKGKLLSGDNGVKKPLSEIKINLMNPSSELIQTTKTDKQGSFAFKYLSSSDNYTIAIDKNNPQLESYKKVIFADEKGVTIKEVEAGKNRDFKFEILPAEKNKMSTMYVDDPWLKIINLSTVNNNKPYEQIITERIYFNVNDDKLLPDAKKTLDKIITVLTGNPNISIVLSSHTDAKGADDYNLKLSERRAKAAVEYITTNGIVATRVTGKGYGETQLLNKCGNNVKCTEEEHAKNRRLEFKVIKK